VLVARGEPFSFTAEQYWREPGPIVEVGDLFEDVPLLSPSLAEITAEDENDRTRVYLPTVIDHALLFRRFPVGWWFLPVLTRDRFDEEEIFERLVEESAEGGAQGWFLSLPLPSGQTDASEEPSLICLPRPTLHRPEFFENFPHRRLASLTNDARELLNHYILEMLEISAPSSEG
jgi:hypothetical protein